MSSDLHPSQLHQHLQMYTSAKWSFWGSLAFSCGLLFLGSTQKPESKPWILGASVGVLEVGRRHRQTAKLLQESLGDIDRASRLNFQAWAKANTQPTAQLAVTVGAIDANWKPENLITDPVGYIQKNKSTSLWSVELVTVNQRLPSTYPPKLAVESLSMIPMPSRTIGRG
ncbi:hypothetical protein [Nostoc sp. 'Peltigera malacea cyanobiont' DB3992]|uniref:hypothetical protein n=1 Tax=Nostoc sp. 'Peltigera malacea cyanobiont' DB3992 TaxID=1206980 RepID=UPI000C03BE60|nr:hypothetical protein [Nostoc sp. 'Peltigera malacea cyanobiont' DB3992]PHM11653.1 hypothetical protein CK516_01555 [Nostoc sp. 'Peltigera malacea cyanobiont' DB3992]